MAGKLCGGEEPICILLILTILNSSNNCGISTGGKTIYKVEQRLDGRNRSLYVVHSCPCNCNIDWVLFYGELSLDNAHISLIKKFDNMGISLMDEDFIYESLAEKIWVTF